MASNQHDPVAEFLGAVVFLAGVGLVGLAFYYAFAIFRMPTAELLGLAPGEEIELAETGTLAVGVVLKIFFLLVMTILGSVIANRGIRMYASGRSAVLHGPKEKEDPDIDRGERPEEQSTKQ